MSKWFNARFSLVSVGLVILAACGQSGQQDDEGDVPHASNAGVVTRADVNVDEVASAEPGKDRHQWDAADQPTRQATGNLTASIEGLGGPLMLAFATGITEQGERDVRLIASDRVGVGPMKFDTILRSNPNAAVYLYRVTNEDIASVARNGGLCAHDRTRYLAVSEYVGNKGDWVFKVAAFKGAVRPGPGASAEPTLCGSYFYVAP